MAKGGEIFILKMPALRIRDLAEVMIEELAPKYGYAPESISVKVIGKRLGEKTHEELLTEDEVLGAHETQDMFVITQAIDQKEKRRKPKKHITKEGTLLTKDEIRKMLSKTNSYNMH